MSWLTRERYGKVGSVHRRVGLLEFRDEVFITKDGGVGLVMRVGGADGEVMEDHQIDSATLRWEQAAASLRDETTLYQYWFKRQGTNAPAETPCGNGITDEIAAEKHGQLLNLYQIDAFVVLVHHPVKVKALPFSERNRLDIDRDIISGAIAVLMDEAANFVQHLEDVTPCRVLGQTDAFAMLRRILNLSRDKAEAIASPNGPAELDRQLCDTDIDVYPSYVSNVIDPWFAKVLTLGNVLPQFAAGDSDAQGSHPMLWRELLELRADFHLVAEWRKRSDEVARIKKKREMMWNQRKSMWTQLSEIITKKESTKESKPVAFDTAKLKAVDDLKKVEEDVENGQIIGDFSLTAVAHGESKEAMEKGAAEIRRVFTRRGFHVFEEGLNLPCALWATMPGGTCFNRRLMKLYCSQMADMGLFWAPAKGADGNKHLRGPNLLTLETREGTAYGFNFHAGSDKMDLGHTSIVGQSGSGKSFLLKTAITQAVKHDPYILAFTMGGGFEFPIVAIGGKYCALSMDSLDEGIVPFRINPFACAATLDNVVFVSKFVRFLVERDGQELDIDEARDLNERVKDVFLLDPRDRTLSTLTRILERVLQERLSELWVRPHGRYAWAFDNVEDDLRFSKRQCFDFEGAKNHPDFMEAMLFYALHRFETSVMDKAGLTVPKMAVFDEFWYYLKNARFIQYLELFLRTMRRKNGWVVFATQDAEELKRSSVMSLLRVACPTKILLANPEMDRRQYQEWFELTNREVELAVALQPKGPMLIKQRGIGTKVAILRPDKLSRWLFTDDAYESQRRLDMVREHGDRWLEIIKEEVA
jgi:type IV secretion system protein VirB4